MRRQHEHREQGIFVAEGEKVVRRLLESRFSVVSVLLPEKMVARTRPPRGRPLLMGVGGWRVRQQAGLRIDACRTVEHTK